MSIPPLIEHSPLVTLSIKELTERSKEHNLPSSRIRSDDKPEHQQQLFFLLECAKQTKQQHTDWQALQDGTISTVNMSKYSYGPYIYVTKSDTIYIRGVCTSCRYTMCPKITFQDAPTVDIWHIDSKEKNIKQCRAKNRRLNADHFIPLNYDIWTGPQMLLSQQVIDELKQSKTKIIGIAEALEPTQNNNNQINTDSMQSSSASAQTKHQSGISGHCHHSIISNGINIISHPKQIGDPNNNISIQSRMTTLNHFNKAAPNPNAPIPSTMSLSNISRKRKLNQTMKHCDVNKDVHNYNIKSLEPPSKRHKSNSATTSKTNESFKPILCQQITGPLSSPGDDSDFSEDIDIDIDFGISLKEEKRDEAVANNSTEKNIDEYIKNIVYVKDIDIGSFGRIVLVYHNDNSMILMAVKIIKKQKQQLFIKKGDQTEIERELSVMQKLNGILYIVNLIKYVETKCYYHFFMELMDTNLEVHLQGMDPQNVEEKKTIFQKTMVSVSSGLKSMHDIDLVHCDIKPQNILLNYEQSSVKLTDFGSTIDAKTGFPTKITEGYYPELHRETSTVIDHDFSKFGVDIFGLGQVLFAILHPSKSATEFMKLAPTDHSRSDYIVSQQTKIFVSCSQSKYTQKWSKEMEIIRKCINPHHETRIGLEQLMDDLYYKQSVHISSQTPLSIPPNAVPNAVNQLYAKDIPYLEYLNSIKNKL